MMWSVLVFVWFWPLVAGWQLVLKVPRGGALGSHDSVYDLWTSNTTLNEEIDNPMNILPGVTYKSRNSLNWKRNPVSLVKIAFYEGSEEKAHIVFSAPTPRTNPAAGSRYNHSDWPTLGTTDWFDCRHIVLSSWGDLGGAVPNVCDMERLGTVAHSFSILNSTIDSQSDCDHVAGWFTVLEPASSNSAIKCAWQPPGVTPHFLYVPGNKSRLLAEARSADVFAIFVDDCIDEVLCRSGTCWQDPLGECHCYDYKCTEACSDLPCQHDGICVPSPSNESEYTCACEDGYTGKNCESVSEESSGLSTGAIAGLCVGIVVFLGIVAGAAVCSYIWRHKDDKLGRSVTERAVIAKDTLRRSFRRFSGSHYPPRKHLREEKPSPTLAGKSAEQLSPDSNVVFGEVNPVYIETPPTTKRYTEFPAKDASEKSISANEIQLHEFKHSSGALSPANPEARHMQKTYENVPFSPADYRSNELSPSFDFEQASTMSEMSDTTTTSGYAGSGYAGSGYAGSGYAGSEQLNEAPAHLPPSEMISKDVIYHHRNRPKARSRPRSRGVIDPPRTLAPQTMENQIIYAIESSRRSISSLSSASSDAIGSDRATKTDVLKVRYIPSNQNRSSASRPKSDSLSETGTRDSSFDNESRSVDSLDRSHDSLERSNDSLDVSHDPNPRSHDRSHDRLSDTAARAHTNDIWSHDLDRDRQSHDKKNTSHDTDSQSDKRIYNKNSRAFVNDQNSKGRVLRSVEKQGLSGKKMPYALHKSYDCLAMSHDQGEGHDGKVERQLDRRYRAKSMENLSDRKMTIVLDSNIAEATV